MQDSALIRITSVVLGLLLLLPTIANAQEAAAPALPVEGQTGDITLDAAATDGAPQQSPFPPEVQAALEKFKARDFAGAEALLKEASAANPKLPPAGVLLGTLYFKANQPNAARAAFEQAVRDNPGDPEAYVVFGENALQQRRFTDGILLFEKAAAVGESYTQNPERQRNMQLRAQNGIAAVAEARGDFAASEAALNKVLQTDSANVAAMTRLGRVLFSKKDEQGAYDAFKKLYEVDPVKMTRYEINMARLYQADNQPGKAEKLINLALERDGENLATVLACGQWALETGKVDFAQTIADKAGKVDDESMQVHLLKGLIARMKADSGTAETAFRKAQTLKPSNAIVLNQLAIALGSQESEEKMKQAFEFSQMATRLFPDSRSPIGRECGVTLAWVLSRLDKKDAALKQLQMAVQNGPVGPDASFFAAEVLHKYGRSDTAIQLLQGAIESGKGVFPAKKQAEDLLRKIRGM